MINASYSMNAMVHNTQWVTGHFHLIFAGTSVIMYFGVAYYLWPKMTGRALSSVRLANTQLWLWFVGMLVLTLPWHQIGITGQPRRVSSTPYDESLVQNWATSEMLMVAAHDWDIAGASAAGCPTAFVTRPGVSWSLPHSPPGLVVEDLTELVGALRDG